MITSYWLIYSLHVSTQLDMYIVHLVCTYLPSLHVMRTYVCKCMHVWVATYVYMCLYACVCAYIATVYGCILNNYWFAMYWSRGRNLILILLQSTHGQLYNMSHINKWWLGGTMGGCRQILLEAGLVASQRAAWVCLMAPKNDVSNSMRIEVLNEVMLCRWPLICNVNWLLQAWCTYIDLSHKSINYTSRKQWQLYS